MSDGTDAGLTTLEQAREEYASLDRFLRAHPLDVDDTTRAMLALGVTGVLAVIALAEAADDLATIAQLLHTLDVSGRHVAPPEHGSTPA